MTLWVDAHLSPALAPWLTERFEAVEAFSVRRLGLRDAEDSEIFEAARSAGAVVMTKDRDFVELVHQRGSPPHVLWITCGNTSNAHMRTILESTLEEALVLLRRGEPVVEISDL